MSAPQVSPPAGGGGGGGGISGSGTAGYVAKFTSSTAVGNSLVRDDGSQVSIDVTPSPGYKLTVNGDTTIAGRIDALTGSINTVTSRASNDLVFQRDTVEAARIIAGGKVGFGNTDPATLIETYGTTGIRASSDTVANVGVFQYSSDTSPATLTLRKARGTRAAQTTVATGDAMGSVNFTAYGGTSGSVLSSISGNVVTYTSNANISSNLTFGTSAAGAATPTTRLTIDEAGVSTFTGPVRATGTSAGAPAFTGSDTDTGMYFPANNQVRLSTAGSVAVAVDASQNVGVQNANPSYPLHVGGGNNTGIVTTGPTAYVATNGATSIVVRDATNGIESFLYAGSSVVLAGAASNHPYQIRTNNATRITVSAAGDTSIANTLSFNSGFGSAAVAYGTRAWVKITGNANTNLSGTYSQSGTTTVTVNATAHGLGVGSSFAITFSTGTGVAGVYTVATAATDSFTYTAGTSLTTSGNCSLTRNTVQASGNVSSVGDGGAGIYYISFTNAMPDINYAISGTAQWTGGPFLFTEGGATSGAGLRTVTQCTVLTGTSAGVATDVANVNVVITR